MKTPRVVTLKRWPSGFVTSAREAEDGWIQLVSTNQSGTSSVRLRLDAEEAAGLLEFLARDREAAAGMAKVEDVARWLRLRYDWKRRLDDNDAYCSAVIVAASMLENRSWRTDLERLDAATTAKEGT